MGIRLPNGTPVEQSELYRAGLVEVQDEGSQLVGDALAAKPGEWLVDLCAGAGGKTLQLAAAMNNQGALLACDIDRARLQRLAPRAERAGATIIESRLLNPGQETEMLSDWAGKADGVLIDAPCSGTGTWRRNPEARWRLTPERLTRLTAMQVQVLEIGARLVKPGGRLVYIVCSLLDAEGAEQVAAFLSRHSGWSVEPSGPAIATLHGSGRRLDPATHGTDGFCRLPPGHASIRPSATSGVSHAFVVPGRRRRTGGGFAFHFAQRPASGQSDRCPLDAVAGTGTGAEGRR